MALSTPFTSGTDPIGIPLPRGYKLVLRVENVTSVLVYISVDSTVSANNADYFLAGGEGLEIKSDQAAMVNVLAGTGTPKIFWRIEPLTVWN